MFSKRGKDLEDAPCPAGFTYRQLCALGFWDSDDVLEDSNLSYPYLPIYLYY